MLRKSVTCITRQALTWNPQGKRKQGHPRNTWRCDLETETKRSCYTWGQLERLAQDRDAWRTLVGGLCSSWGLRQWWWWWWQLERLAQDRDAWRALVGGLCFSRGQRQWWWLTFGFWFVASAVPSASKTKERRREELPAGALWSHVASLFTSRVPAMTKWLLPSD